MPGFFTKAKPKDEEGDGADSELLKKTIDTKPADNSTKENDDKTENPAGTKSPRKNIFAALKFRNPFTKREPVKIEDAAPENKNIGK